MKNTSSYYGNYTTYCEKIQKAEFIEKHGFSCPEDEDPELLSQCIEAGDRDKDPR